MPSEPPAEDRRQPEIPAPTPGAAAAQVDPDHDQTTSREAYEREMAEQDRSDEAGRRGDHID